MTCAVAPWSYTSDGRTWVFSLVGVFPKHPGGYRLAGKSVPHQLSMVSFGQLILPSNRRRVWGAAGDYSSGSAYT